MDVHKITNNLISKLISDYFFKAFIDSKKFTAYYCGQKGCAKTDSE